MEKLKNCNFPETDNRSLWCSPDLTPIGFHLCSYLYFQCDSKGKLHSHSGVTALPLFPSPPWARNNCPGSSNIERVSVPLPETGMQSGVRSVAQDGGVEEAIFFFNPYFYLATLLQARWTAIWMTLKDARTCSGRIVLSQSSMPQAWNQQLGALQKGMEDNNNDWDLF